jgi:mannitol/fructose-specific phosphotransferase system IIA component
VIITKYKIPTHKINLAFQKLKLFKNEKAANGLHEKQILLSCKAQTKEEAIQLVGSHMVDLGFTETSYIKEMIQREESFSTYIGNGIAIPHGYFLDSPSIKKSGIVIAQFPKGISFNEHQVYLLIGIAGKGEEQVQVLSRIAEIIENEEGMKRLWSTPSMTEFLSVFNVIL